MGLISMSGGSPSTRALWVWLGAACLLALTACGEKAPEEKGPAEAPATESFLKLEDELTSEKGIPSILEETLSPEEKSDLLNRIMPSSPDETTPEEKFMRLRQDADAGNPEAQTALGVMYYTGEAISKDSSGRILSNDPETAAAWFHRAAQQGYAAAQFNLGLMYANGEGVPKDSAKAVDLFRSAAEQGNVDAQNNLGVMYYAGEGIPRDAAQARTWFEKAAANGNADAQANLEAMK